MLRPLYLDGAERPVAVLRDGPALRLRREGAADVFMPLPQLARVIVHGPRVQWRTEALLACMEAGVPIVFAGARDTACGVCVSLRPPAQRTGLASLLEAAAARPGFTDRLENLARAWERRAIRGVLAGARLATRDLRPNAVRTLCRERLRADAAVTEALCATFETACAALVLSSLTRRWLGPRFLARCAGGFDLAGRLSGILGWPLWPALWRLDAYLCRHADKHGTPAQLRQRAIRAFEAEVPRLERILADLLAQLAAELALEEW